MYLLTCWSPYWRQLTSPLRSLHFQTSNLHLLHPLYISFLLWLFYAPQLSRDVPADAGFLCDKIAALSETLKETTMYILIHCYFTVTRRNYLLSSPCQTATSPLPLWLAPDVCTSQRVLTLCTMIKRKAGRLRLKRDGTRAETRFRLSAKRTSPFKSVGASVQSTADSRGVRISGSNAGYTMFGGSVRVLATHSIRQFPVYVLTRASPCAITFQLDSTHL